MGGGKGLDANFLGGAQGAGWTDLTNVDPSLFSGDEGLAAQTFIPAGSAGSFSPVGWASGGTSSVPAAGKGKGGGSMSPEIQKMGLQLATNTLQGNQVKPATSGAKFDNLINSAARRYAAENPQDMSSTATGLDQARQAATGENVPSRDTQRFAPAGSGANFDGERFLSMLATLPDDQRSELLGGFQQTSSLLGPYGFFNLNERY